MTRRGLFLLCLLGAQIIASVVSLTMDEIISNAAQTTGEFAFFQSVDSEKPSVKVELDMIFTAEQWDEIQRLNGSSTFNSRRNKRKAIRSSDYRWDNDVIAYKIASYVFTYSEEQEILKALDEWAKYTCISFRRALSTDRNFILFDNGDGCYSNVGMIGGSQEVGLARGCRTKGVIVHEVGHAVGFHHEQTRPDRDEYVEIVQQNIPPHIYYNFQKYTASVVNIFGVPYDYESVMHYGAKAFSVNGGDTIRTKDPKYQSVIGNRNGLSFRDIKLANLMYTCSQKAGCGDIKCPGEGFLDKNCRCQCPGNPVRECSGITPGPEIRKTTVAVTKTGTGIVTRPTTGLCADKYLSCQTWADKGECNTNFMMTYCKKSCQKCSDGGQNKICVNLHRYCEDWRKLGHCTGRYAIYMRSNCAKACGLCVSSDQRASSPAPTSTRRTDDVSDQYSSACTPSQSTAICLLVMAASFLRV